MSKLETRWIIDGVPAVCIIRRGISGRYRVLFERDAAGPDTIEHINWSQPAIAAAGESEGDGLPAGCGFDLVDLTYQHATRCFIAELKLSAQYLGDVSGYQAEIKQLNKTISGKDAVITAQQTAAEELKQDLRSAYEEGVESHG